MSPLWGWWMDIHLFYKYVIPLGFLAMVLRNLRLSGSKPGFTEPCSIVPFEPLWVRLNANLVRGDIFIEKEITKTHVNYAFIDNC